MSTPARRRLIRDFRRLRADNTTGITAAPVGDDIMSWQAIIFGPDNTAWENGVFKLYMRFSEEYPTRPPQIGFLSKIFHPNIYSNGNICLDILQNQWTPIYDITKILTSIQSLLTDPNPNSPANAEAARLYTENCREYERRVHDCVEQSMLEFNQSLMEDSGDEGAGIDNNCNFDVDDDTLNHDDPIVSTRGDPTITTHDEQIVHEEADVSTADKGS